MNQKDVRCAICLNNIYMGGNSCLINNTLYIKSSQSLAMKRLHEGKSSHSKYRITHSLLCGHLFHKNCIKKWFRKNPTCPLCRK